MDSLILLALMLIGILGVGFSLFLVYIYVTSGFENTGRLTGGLYTIRGRPSCGKTYVATSIAIETMKEGKRKVFSNYPIIYDDGVKKISSLFFDPKYIYEKNLNGSLIIHDESHQENYSRDFKQFNKQKMAFYSRCSQHGITYYSIVQHEDRQDTIINDVSDLFCDIEKVEIPFLEIPIYFRLTWWASEEDMKQSRFQELDPYHYERIWFNKEVANAYSTKFFGKDERIPFEGQSWINYNKEHNIESRPSDDYSKIRKSYLWIRKNLLLPMTKGIMMVINRKTFEGMKEQGIRNDHNLEKNVEIKEGENNEQRDETKY